MRLWCVLVGVGICIKGRKLRVVRMGINGGKDGRLGCRKCVGLWKYLWKIGKMFKICLKML